jgi:guanylate kinase
MSVEVPESEILESIECKETGIPCVYRCVDYEPNPNLPTLVCITGTSGSGKDTVMTELINEGLLEHVVTATNRKRRYKEDERFSSEIEEEISKCKDVDSYNECLDRFFREGKLLEVGPIGEYVWMRWRRPDESKEDYYNSLRSEYNLLESSEHYRALYGLPKSSLDKFTGSVLPLARVDINGIETYRKIFKGVYNIFVVGILPDSWNQIESAIRERQSNEGDIELRISQDRSNINRYSNLVNYIIQNSRNEVSGCKGLDYTVNVLIDLIKRNIY